MVTGKFFAPGQKLMQRLSYKGKFGLIAFAFLLPLSLVGYFFLKEIGAGLAFAHNERSGVEYLKPAYKYLADTLRGNDNGSAWTGVTDAEQKLGGSLSTAEQFKSLEQAHGKDSALAAGQAAQALIGTIGNNSQLVLDPDIDSYYTMDVVAVQLENICLRLAEARDLGKTVTERGTATSDEKTALIVLSGQLMAPLDTVQSDLKQSIGANPTLEAKYKDPLAKLVKDVGEFNTLIKQTAAGETKSINKAALTNSASVALDSATKLFDVCSDSLDSLLVSRAEGYSTRRLYVCWSVFAFLLLATYLFVSFYNSSVANLQGLLASARSIANGDITHQVPVLGDDEVGRLAQDLSALSQSLGETARAAERIANGDMNVSLVPRSDQDVLGKSLQNMVTNLRQLIGDVQLRVQEMDSIRSKVKSVAVSAQSAVASMDSSIHELVDIGESTAQASHQVAQGSEEQAHTCSNSLNAMESLDSVLLRISEVVAEQQNVVGQTLLATQDGVHQSEQVQQSMKSIRKEVATCSDEVEALGRYSGSIGDIVQTIGDIATQTNLLALNAAIEAARAGEHGHGFAVVADEVRKLAMRCTKSTEDISALLSKVQLGVSNSLKAVQQTKAGVDAGDQAVALSGQELHSILSSVENTRQNADALFGSIAGMRERSESLRNMIVSIAASSEEAAAAAQQMSAGAQEVSRQTSSLSGDAVRQSEMTNNLLAVVQDLEAVSIQLSESISQFSAEPSPTVSRKAA